MRTSKKQLLLVGSLGLIILGIAIASIVDRLTSANNAPSDIRARAGVVRNLKVNATVTTTDPIKGTVTVTNLYLSDQNRSGDAKDLGMWLVTAPPQFNFSTIHGGVNVVIEVKATSFLIDKHTLTAISIVPQ